MKQEQGFSLLEVMISVFVLAIGLLGLAGLQLTSMQNGHSAFLRSQASLAACSILDDMRANRANKDDYEITMAATASGTSGLAKTDVDSWLADLAAMLPDGDGSVGVNGNQVTVEVRWSDRGTQGATKTFTLVTDL